MTDAVVVGAGIVGTATAFELARRGAAVTLVDRAGISEGTTGLGEGNVLCSVPILEPDPQEDGDDASGIVDMSDCAEFLPPSSDRLWFLEVIDNAAEDEGTIDEFSVLAPDGTVLATAGDLPVDIPDADETGVAVIAS